MGARALITLPASAIAATNSATRRAQGSDPTSLTRAMEASMLPPISPRRGVEA
ncbi:hypothetical protein RSAG8_06867, partial [Rhizoctonia solani AG-8 WAC10335]